MEQVPDAKLMRLASQILKWNMTCLCTTLYNPYWMCCGSWKGFTNKLDSFSGLFFILSNFFFSLSLLTMSDIFRQQYLFSGRWYFKTETCNNHWAQNKLWLLVETHPFCRLNRELITHKASYYLRLKSNRH